MTSMTIEEAMLVGWIFAGLIIFIGAMLKATR